MKFKDEISLLKNQFIDGKMVRLLDLGNLFVSLNNNEYASLILSSLKSFYYPKESGYNKVINYYLQQYDELVNKLGYYPNNEELKLHFNNLDKYNILSFDGEKMNKVTILEEVQKYLKYIHAKEMMINCNLRLVVNIAKRYDTNIELIDLINEGNLGLMQAVDRFDESLGYRFSTYAFYWIRQHVSRYIYNCSSSVKITENFKYQLIVFKKKLYKLEQEYKRNLSILEISKCLNMPIKKVIDYLSFSYTTISLDEIAFDDEGEITYGDLTRDPDTDVLEITTQNILKEDIETLLAKLKPREAMVMKLRYGIGVKNEKRATLQEVGQVMGITRERARQIEKKAITKLKKIAKFPAFSHLSEY